MENKELPLVTIIIPVLNEERHIKNCLEDILNQNYPQDKIEVFIVDGGSKDNTIEIIRGFIKNHSSFGATIIDKIGKSISAAMNLGLKQAGGDIVVKVDAHTKYELDYVSKCVEYLGKTGADCVGGPIRPKGTNYLSQAISLALKTSFGSGGGKFHREDYEGYADTVYLGAYKKEVLKKIGGWDERIIDEDEDLNYRLRKSGSKIYLIPKIKSYYYVYPTIKKIWSLYFEYGYSKVFFIKKHRILGSWHHIIPSVFVSGLMGSFLLGFIFWPLRVLFILILGPYLIISFLVSVQISLKHGLKYFPVLPIIFVILHLSYGIGFLKGIFNTFSIKE